jgi:transcriptional regulator with XRE-family HTH domain
LAADNKQRQCARCQRVSRDKLIAAPEVPAEFWGTEQFRAAFAAQHMGWVSRAYRTHPYHHAVYGPGGISQTLLGQWLGLRQPQVSQIETGSPIRHLDVLQHWARVLRIPAELLWFAMPGQPRQGAGTESAAADLAPVSQGAGELPAGPAPVQGQPGADSSEEHVHDPECDPVLLAPWNQRGTVEVAVLLSGGGGRVKRRVLLSLTGPGLTAPAHQWLVHEPGPLVSGLVGRRVSGELVGRLAAIVVELRRMDDVAGGGGVLVMAQQTFAWVAGLLDRASYDEPTGRALYVVLAELGQLCGWAALDDGNYGLAQRYNIAALRTAHSADDRPLGAHALATMAHQAARQGQPDEAVTVARSPS